MAAAIITDLPVTPDVIESVDGSRLTMRSNRRSFGNRVLGVTTLFGVTALMMLLAHTVIGSMILARHVELDRLDKLKDQERESVRELEIELQTRTAPTEIELLANGDMGMVPAKSTTQISVLAEHLDSGHQLEPILFKPRMGREWSSVDRLLTEALAIAASNSGR
ncbi:MAG TPA: hypothetical protein QF409_04120 [Acidimicrobiales bacterium]|nr:hypothetical protein [Acidimicrobiales bacterium]